MFERKFAEQVVHTAGTWEGTVLEHDTESVTEHSEDNKAEVVEPDTAGLEGQDIHCRRQPMILDEMYKDIYV